MRAGTVYLVGAGPGDPGLITVRGLELVESADVVVFDRLVDRRLLERARPGAELVDVGKVPGQRRNRQEDINALLVARAREGKQVVRLKGGDPFVFGRGGEEAEALLAEGIPFEVVPGVTSAVAAPAYAGIPVTHRKLGSFFTVVTGSEAPDKDASAVPWDRLAQLGGTLVVLMGWEGLASIVDALLRHGRAPETPVALVRWGTEPYQRTVSGTLADIVEKAQQADLSPPVVAVVGEVASLRQKLRWFDNRPLFGKRVLVTRSRAQASALSGLLARRGALPLELPAIEVQPLQDCAGLDAALRGLGQGGYQWVVFTSANAVQAVFQRLDALGLDARAFGAARVAAIGPATAASLRQRGIRADLTPEDFVSEAVAAALEARAVSGQRVLLPRADIAPEELARRLEALGALVHEVPAYRTVVPEESRGRAKEVCAQGIDIATFTSSSTVRNLADLLAGDLSPLSGATVACIGPVTAATARELGLKVDIVAREHTVPGLVEALESYFAQEGAAHG